MTPVHPCLVVGIGNEFRRDDGAGPAVAERVRAMTTGISVLGPLAGPLDLLGLWDDCPLAVVVDAAASGAPAGTVRLVELCPTTARDAVMRSATTTTTHGVGVAGAYRLACATSHAPARVIVVAIEGCDFGPGTGLSPAVGAAVEEAARQVVQLVGAAP